VEEKNTYLQRRKGDTRAASQISSSYTTHQEGHAMYGQIALYKRKRGGGGIMHGGVSERVVDCFIRNEGVRPLNWEII